MSISKKIFMFLFFFMLAVPVSCEQYLAIGRTVTKMAGETVGQQGSIGIYEVGRWVQMQSLELLGQAQKKPEDVQKPTDLVFSPGGKYLACIDDKNKATIYRTDRWEEDQWEVKKTFKDVESIAFSADDKFFAYSKKKDKGAGKILLYDTQSWQERTAADVINGYCKTIGFTKSGYLVGLTTESQIIFWSFDSRTNSFKVFDNFYATNKKIISMDTSAKGDKVIALMVKNEDVYTVRALNVKKGLKEISRRGVNTSIKGHPIALSPSGKYAAYSEGIEEFAVRIFLSRDIKSSQSFDLQTIEKPKQLAFSFDDKYLAVLHDKGIEMYEKKMFSGWEAKGSVLGKIEFTPTAISFSPKIKLPKKKKGKKKRSFGDISSSLGKMFEGLEDLSPHEKSPHEN